MLKKLESLFNYLNKPRLECLQSLMLGIVNARSIQIRRIAQRFGSKAKLESVEKQIKRFFSEVSIDDTMVALFAEKILSLRRMPAVTVIIDRTQLEVWKYTS